MGSRFSFIAVCLWIGFSIAAAAIGVVALIVLTIDWFGLSGDTAWWAHLFATFAASGAMFAAAAALWRRRRHEIGEWMAEAEQDQAPPTGPRGAAARAAGE